MTRERRWRAELLKLVAPVAGETILDVGCGTGTFAVMLKQACPEARVIGVDPDEAFLAFARAKAAAAGVEVELRRAIGDELARAVSERADKAVSSLVLRQCPLLMKSAILRSVHDSLRPSGRLCIADYGAQRTRRMRLLFRQVQQLDGFENTQPNADGVLPDLITGAGFGPVVEHRTMPTPTGSIAILSATRPQETALGVRLDSSDMR